MKSLTKLFSVKASPEKAEKIVRLIYFGLLRRLPEKNTLNHLISKISEGLEPAELLESVMQSSEFRQQITHDQAEIYLSLLPRENHAAGLESFKFTSYGQHQEIKKIIYLCPAISSPIGGVKVLARHSDIINKLRLDHIVSEIYFPDNPEFSLDWFSHEAKVKRDPLINKDYDIIVIPEIWALKYGALMFKENVKYAIFVQNGYYIFDEIIQGDQSELQLLQKIYQNAACILAISANTSQCITEAFDIPTDAIQIVTPSINENIFTSDQKNKKNIITYMPRKLSTHASYIINRLLLREDTLWEILPIEGLTEAEVARHLSSSKIFLSFSDREGFSLPPLEAAFCGNIVIGYTGEGALEYWGRPLFKKIENGKLLEFIQAIESEIVQLSSQELAASLDEKQKAREALKEKYSSEAERHHLRKFISKLRSNSAAKEHPLQIA